MASETWESKRNPFEGVPGLRAGFFRALFRFRVFLERKNSAHDLAEDALRRDRERQLTWSRTCSNPKANLVVDLFICLLVCGAVLFFSLSGRNRVVVPGEILPEQRTNTVIGVA